MPVEIPPEVANHVLFVFRSGGYPPGSFTQSLIETITRGDRENQARLAKAFPEYVAAVQMAERDFHGLDTLSTLARP